MFGLLGVVVWVVSFVGDSVGRLIWMLMWLSSGFDSLCR